MLCENCGARPAVVRVRHHLDGHEETYDLCNHCASAVGVGMDAQSPFGSLERMFERMFGPRPRRREDLLARLSEAAQRVIERAARLTVEWGHDRVTTEFLLLALLEEDSVRRALAESGIATDAFEGRLDAVVGRREAKEVTALALSSAMKRVLQIARMEAVRQGRDYVGPEHLLLGLLVEGESFASQFLAGVDPERVGQHLPGGPAADAEEPPPLPPNLGRFARDLTALARAGEVDPVIGREREIDRVIRILSRRTKNNPVLVGEPGVGKTAIAEGLAQRIVSGDVPDILHDKRVLSFDLGATIAGTKYRGEFEERFKGVMDEIRALKGQIILFVDEIHTVVGAGAAEGAIDASNLLKPALARGELQCLGATTLDEYRKHLEKDAALERRFQPVLVAEPTPEQAIEILRGLRDTYEAHHRVRIRDDAVVAAVELSERHVTDRFLPDKALDLVDEAAAMVRLGARVPPDGLKDTEARLAELEAEKNAAVAGERYDEAARLKQEADALRTELEALAEQWQHRQGTSEPIVTPEDVATIVSEWTGIPAQRLRAEETERLLRMEEVLNQRVIGQDEAIVAVSAAVRRARAGLKDPKRPIGSFLFLGPTGVGKTETARALAEFLFADDDAMIRFDMSEFQERHTVSKLIGAPPGYVGYEEAGKLTEAVRRRPYAVLLFDEIEKAHPDVFNLLLQLLDDGRLTDSRGRTVNFTNTVVILTSNVGARDLPRADVGFARSATEDQRAALLDGLRRHFAPEFLNRIDEIVIFRALDRDHLRRIVDGLFEATRRKLRTQAIDIELTDAARDALVDRGWDPKYGARPLRRAIQREIEDRVGDRLLRSELRAGDAVRVDHQDGAFVFLRRERPAEEDHPPGP